MTTKLFPVKNCAECPNCVTSSTPGTGYGMDYKCKAAKGAMIAGYVERPSEGPQDGVFPKFCPLKDSK